MFFSLTAYSNRLNTAQYTYYIYTQCIYIYTRIYKNQQVYDICLMQVPNVAMVAMLTARQFAGCSTPLVCCPWWSQEPKHVGTEPPTFSEQRSQQFPTENQWPMGPTTSNYHYKSPENVLDAVGSHWDYWSPGMMMWVTSRDEMGFYVTNDRDLVKVGRKFELSINLLLVLTNRWRFWPIIGDDDWWRGTTRWSLTARPNLTPVLLMNPCTGIMVHDWVRSKDEILSCEEIRIVNSGDSLDCFRLFLVFLLTPLIWKNCY